MSANSLGSMRMPKGSPWAQRAPEGLVVLQPEHGRQRGECEPIEQKLRRQRLQGFHGGVNMERENRDSRQQAAGQQAADHQAQEKEQIVVAPEGVRDPEALGDGRRLGLGFGLWVGLWVGLGVSETNPGRVWSVTVRLPGTATALEGTPPCPPTANVRAVPEAKAPERPVPLRVSSRRAGLSETYVAPEVVVGLTVAASCGRTAAAT